MKRTPEWKAFADFLKIGFFDGDQMGADERYAMTERPTRQHFEQSEARLGRGPAPKDWRTKS